MAAVLLAGMTAGAGDPADPLLSARAAYEAGLRADQQGFDEALRSLNGRFKAALATLHVDARNRGDLDETLAAKQLWERVAPLCTAVVFQAAAPVAGTVHCPLPAAPPGQGLIAQAFTNYAGKVSTLAGHFNAAASNRQVRYLATMDQLVRELTKQGNFEDAVKVRDQRAAAAQAGPVRLITAEPLEAPAVSARPAAAPDGAGVAPFLGRWKSPSGPPVRIFRTDKVDYISTEGRVAFSAPFRVEGGTTAVVVFGGWIDVYRIQADGSLSVEGRNAAEGLTNRYKVVRDSGPVLAGAGEGRSRSQADDRVPLLDAAPSAAGANRFADTTWDWYAGASDKAYGRLVLKSGGTSTGIHFVEKWEYVDATHFKVFHKYTGQDFWLMEYDPARREAHSQTNRAPDMYPDAKTMRRVSP